MDVLTQGFKTIETKDLTLQVYHAPESSFGATSVIVFGATEAILIDAQFTAADAEQVAFQIKSIGKKLKAIFISHSDPDYYFGLEIFRKYFPEVAVYATKETVERIQATDEIKLDFWEDIMGLTITSRAILPQVLQTNHLEVDGLRVEIIGLSDHPASTIVWIPSIKAIVGGNWVYGTSFHIWMADSKTAKARRHWMDVLEKMNSLNPELVIPAHANAESRLDHHVIQHTKRYLQYYEEALLMNRTSEKLINSIRTRFPHLTFDVALEIGAQVNTGEIAW